MESTTSRLVLVWVSTTGVAPVTVTVSSTAPTRMSALIVVTPAPVSSMRLAPDRGESGQRERHDVGAGFQIDDPVLAGPIRHDGAGLLDERRTRRFDGYARQDGARRIPDDACDCRLGKCRC